MSAIIECRSVTCRRAGKIVLSEMDFQLESDEAIALLGMSGSGKSTLLRLLAGLLVPDSGTIAIGGKVAAERRRLIVPPHRRRVSMVFQDLGLWPNLTVSGNIALALSGQRLSRREVRARTNEVLDLCGIPDLGTRRPGTLSGGQQQRVALARALAVQPRVLLLDEPFGGLDLITKKSLMNQVTQLRSQLGFTLILVTHDPTEVTTLCESVAVLERGTLVERGPCAEVLANPQSALTRAMADCVA